MIATLMCLRATMFNVGEIVKHRGNHYDAETGLPSISVGFVMEEINDDFYIKVQWFDGAISTHNHYWLLKIEEEDNNV